jgi:hypothetical protein
VAWNNAAAAEQICRYTIFEGQAQLLRSKQIAEARADRGEWNTKVVRVPFHGSNPVEWRVPNARAKNA